MRWRHHLGRALSPFALPAAPVVINPRHFLARQLARVILPGAPDRAMQADRGLGLGPGALMRSLSANPDFANIGAGAAFSTTTITRATDWGGHAAVFDGAATQYRWGSAQAWRPDLALPAPVTMLAVARCANLTGGRTVYSISNSADSSGFPRIDINVGNSGRMRYGYGLTAYAFVETAASFVAAGDLLVFAATSRGPADHALACVNVSSGATAFLTTSTNAGASASTAPTEQVGVLLFNTSAGEFWQGNIYLCAMAPVGVSDAELRALAADPYAILAPAARPEWRPGFAVAALQRRRRIASTFMDDRGLV
jgi:hypothetical protein